MQDMAIVQKIIKGAVYIILAETVISFILFLQSYIVKYLRSIIRGFHKGMVKLLGYNYTGMQVSETRR